MNSIHALKNESTFDTTVAFFKEAKSIAFNASISNEEAMILQNLKQLHGYKLINKEAKRFQNFLNAFASVNDKQLYGASQNTLETFDFALSLGLSMSTDSLETFEALKNAKNERNACINYMHPLEDKSLENIVEQHIKYEVGSEEGLLAMLADIVVSKEGKEKYNSFFNELDEGYICGESSVGEEEFEDLSQKLSQSKKPILIVGPDLYNHPRSKNISKILGMISKYSDIEVLIVGSELNTLGVSLLCDLDEVASGKTAGYGVEGDYTLSCSQEVASTVTLANKQVVVVKTKSFDNGYRLNDIAKALGLGDKNTNDYTAKLPVTSGYKAVAFDDIASGYALEDMDAKNGDDTIEDVDDISEFNGTVVYRCNHSLNQFNPDTSKSDELEGDLVLLGSKQFATAAKVKTGTMVRFEMDGKTYQRKFEVHDDLKGTIAYNPVFDSTDNYDEYRYKRVNLEEVNE